MLRKFRFSSGTVVNLHEVKPISKHAADSQMWKVGYSLNDEKTITWSALKFTCHDEPYFMAGPLCMYIRDFEVA